MARPAVIDDAKLLAVAREVFLKKGMAASTVEIAKKLGIAQGSIFRRYKTKHDLFRAAMLSEAPPWAGSLQQLTEEIGLRAALEKTIHQLLGMYRKTMPLMLMGWSNRTAMGVGRGMKRLSAPPKPALELMAFFESQMRAGRLRKANTGVLGMSLIGPIMAYVLIELVRGSHPVPEKQFVPELIELLWNGYEPRGAKS